MSGKHFDFFLKLRQLEEKSQHKKLQITNQQLTDEILNRKGRRRSALLRIETLKICQLQHTSFLLSIFGLKNKKFTKTFLNLIS